MSSSKSFVVSSLLALHLGVLGVAIAFATEPLPQRTSAPQSLRPPDAFEDSGQMTVWFKQRETMARVVVSYDALPDGRRRFKLWPYTSRNHRSCAKIHDEAQPS